MALSLRKQRCALWLCGVAVCDVHNDDLQVICVLTMTHAAWGTHVPKVASAVS